MWNRKKHKKRALIFGVVYFVFVFANMGISGASSEYIENYPYWFDDMYYCISAENEELFDVLKEKQTYNEVEKALRQASFMRVTDFENTLDKLDKKHMRDEINGFEFDEGYELWFSPIKKDDSGRSFAYVKAAPDGKITDIGMGSSSALYTKSLFPTDYFFFCREYDEITESDVKDRERLFDELKVGDDEEGVVNSFKNVGEIYNLITSRQDGAEKTEYRFYLGTLDYRMSTYYAQLIFVDHELESAAFYETCVGSLTVKSDISVECEE